MPMSTYLPRPWLLQSARVTVFSKTDLAESRPILNFRSIFGNEAEVCEERRKEGIYSESGPLSAGVAAVVFQGARCDIHWSSDPLGDEFAGLGAAQSAVQVLLDKVSPVLSGVKIARIAIGAVCRVEQDSREEAYSHLNGLLSRVTLDPTDTTDFSYSVNHPMTAASLKNLVINRISKWAAVRLVRAERVIGDVVPVVQGPERMFSSIELDFNTTAGLDLFDAGLSLPVVMKIIHEQMLAVLSEGDRGLLEQI